MTIDDQDYGTFGVVNGWTHGTVASGQTADLARAVRHAGGDRQSKQCLMTPMWIMTSPMAHSLAFYLQRGILLRTLLHHGCRISRCPPKGSYRPQRTLANGSLNNT